MGAPDHPHGWVGLGDVVFSGVVLRMSPEALGVTAFSVVVLAATVVLFVVAKSWELDEIEMGQLGASWSFLLGIATMAFLACMEGCRR